MRLTPVEVEQLQKVSRELEQLKRDAQTHREAHPYFKKLQATTLSMWQRLREIAFKEQEHAEQI